MHGTIADFSEADAELRSHFTAAVGISAQHYEPQGSPTLYDSSASLLGIMFGREHDAMAEHLVVERTLAELGPEDQATLRKAYYPRRLGRGTMQVYLSACPAIAQLVPFTRAARHAYDRWCDRRRLEPDEGAGAVLRWLDGEATSANRESTFAPLRAAGERMLLAPLEAYSALRTARLARVASARQDRRKAQERARVDLLQARLAGR